MNRLARGPLPGKLEAKQQLVEWRSPEITPTKITPDNDGTVIFEIVNTGGSPARILESQASCGCTTPKVDLKPIEPGEVRRLEVAQLRFRLGRRS